MASKFYVENTGRHHELLETLQKSGTLNRNTVVHISRDTSAPTESIGSSTVSSEDKRIVLSDGTVIIIESLNEYILIGPSGTRISISCLPLFILPEPSPEITESVATLVASNTSMSSDSNTSGEFSETLKANDTEPDVKGGTLFEPLPNLDDIFTSTNVFSILDPFDNNSHNTNNHSMNFAEESTREKAINKAFNEATSPVVGSASSSSSGIEAVDGGDISDSDDNGMDEDDNEKMPALMVNYVDKLPIKHRAASISFASNIPISKSTVSAGDGSVSLQTTLPPPPVMKFPQYDEKGGWLIKLSHQKGMFGDKWQKRYFILNGSTLCYFKKYGDSQPRGIINLLPGSWCKSVVPGTPRMIDAVAKSGKAGIISVNRCFAVHRPSNYAASLSALLASEDVIDAFSSLTVSLTNPTDASRTFYMIAPSEQERHSWIDAISNNIRAYYRSQEALDKACQELQTILEAVGCRINDKNELSSILVLLYSKRALIGKSIT